MCCVGVVLGTTWSEACSAHVGRQTTYRYWVCWTCSKFIGRSKLQEKPKLRHSRQILRCCKRAQSYKFKENGDFFSLTWNTFGHLAGELRRDPIAASPCSPFLFLPNITPGSTVTSPEQQYILHFLFAILAEFWKRECCVAYHYYDPKYNPIQSIKSVLLAAIYTVVPHKASVCIAKVLLRLRPINLKFEAICQ